MIYLDHNATTRPCPEAARAVIDATERLWANPSSAHRAGQEVRRAVELARASVARLMGTRPRDLVFTSGGTESIATVLRAVADTGTPDAPPRVVTTGVEHAAVRDTLEQLGPRVEVVTVGVGGGGAIDPDAVAAGIARAGDSGPRPALAVFQWANNETGAIQPIELIWRVCRDAGVPLLCDATQWLGKMPVEPETDPGGPPCDLLVGAAHKFHGPKGVGLLWRRRGTRVSPLISGSQELGRRGGTENVPGILGAGAAAEAALAWLADPGERDRLAGLRDRFEEAVLAGARGAGVDAVVNKPDGPRLWNTSNIGFPPLEAEPLLVALSERGVCASAGAACSSGSLEPSPVLLAMGVPEGVAHGSLRFSIGRETTRDELDRASEIIADAVERLARSATAMG